MRADDLLPKIEQLPRHEVSRLLALVAGLYADRYDTWRAVRALTHLRNALAAPEQIRRHSR